MLEDQPWGEKSLQGWQGGGDSTELCRAVLPGRWGVLGGICPIPTQEGQPLLQRWFISDLTAPGEWRISCKPQQQLWASCSQLAGGPGSTLG